MKRCSWVNLNNPNYVKYHDYEWSVISHDDEYLFEMLVLEMFQAGLSWECILNKRENFRECLDNFDYKKIANYDDKKIQELLKNEKIIRNKLKIKAMIKNAKIFMDIQRKYGSFDKFIWEYSDYKVIKNIDGIMRSTSELSDKISHDLYQLGMSFVGSTIIYSYLQAIGMIDDHEKECFKY